MLNTYMSSRQQWTHHNEAPYLFDYPSNNLGETTACFVTCAAEGYKVTCINTLDAWQPLDGRSSHSRHTERSSRSPGCLWNRYIRNPPALFDLLLCSDIWIRL